MSHFERNTKLRVGPKLEGALHPILSGKLNLLSDLILSVLAEESLCLELPNPSTAIVSTDRRRIYTRASR
jgi:hypothetical protein